MQRRKNLPNFMLFLLMGCIGLLPALDTDALAQGTRLLRNPDVGADSIVFVHANDLWLVSRQGGEARRLTSSEGAETDPAFSSDGHWIAFTGQYGGNTDVFIVPSDGGEPRRLTWHPSADIVQGWTADGKILFQSSRDGHPTQLWRFYTVSIEGELPAALALPQAYDGEMSADGDWLAYQEVGFWDPEWRNYRGGQAQPISVVSTETWERLTPPWEGERQMSPVWMDGTVFYISERDWAANVWCWNRETGEERQLTFHSDFDVKSLGAGHGVVVYEQGGYLHELDPSSGKSRQLEIRVAADLNWARPRWVDINASALRDPRLSPTGKRALFEYRGELFTVPAEKGSWRNITETPGIADRHAVWSPQGDRIAWFSDEGGEYGLVVADQDGRNPRRLEISEPSFYFDPVWSPDGTRLAFTDTHYRILVIDLESGAVKHVATDRYAHPERSTHPVWSPDSRWIAYSRRLETQLRAVFVYDTREEETHQLTSGMADSISPIWDASGKYLYFLASTNYGLNTGWLDMTSYERPVTRALYLALLKQDEPSPFLPKSDEESGEQGPEEKASGEEPGEAKDAESRAGEEGKDGETEKSKTIPDVVIDFAGISSRIVDAPKLPLGDYLGLVEGPEGQVFLGEDVPGEPSMTLQRYTVKDQKVEKFAEKVSQVVSSHDRKKLLYRSNDTWMIVNSSGRPPSGKNSDSVKKLALSSLRTRVDPRAEWAQMLRDGWRFMRDFLYVDNVHGAPWDQVWEWYKPWLEGVSHRSDFNHLLDILSGEVAVGHSYVRGGDYPDLTDPRTGLLGVDLEESEGFYRIRHIYTGEEWNPGLAGPLSIPGLNVSVGDYLVAIDGKPLRVPENPFRLLEGTAGRTITVSVSNQPSIEDAREMLVEPASSERELRTWAWVEANRKKVEQASEGKLAYVWLPNTGPGGYTYFNRMYFAQQDKQGAVIDERNNGGGSAADYIVEVLSRQLTGYFNSRAGDRKPWTQPMAGLWGPKVMIINERAGSGGDLLPYLFRFRKVGPLVGTRTWGGLVGTWDTPPLLDGGRFVAPRGGFFDVNGEWAVEGEGVAPDIEVRNDPQPVISGRDPQLERAVQEALRLLETEGVELKPEPPAPVRWRRPDPR